MDHKQRVRDWFRSLAADAGADDPDELAEELLIVLNGAYVTADILSGAAYGKRALRMARRLVDDACLALGPGKPPANAGPTAAASIRAHPSDGRVGP